MLHTLSIWILVAALLGAGAFNAISLPATRSDFVRWGYPPWWGRLTGGLEVVAAALIAVPGSRDAGLILGALIVVAAVLTVLRHREVSHLVPLGVFMALLALTEMSS